MSGVPATSRDETPVWFAAGEETLFGVHTAATGTSRGVGVIFAAGGGTPLATGVNGFAVRLSRMAAAMGFESLRFDYHGVGESTGTLDRFHLAEPFALDLQGAIGCLRQRGIERLVLIGSCFGARTVLAVASETAGVVGTLLIAPPVRDFEMGERIATQLAERSTWWGLVRRAARPQTVRKMLDAENRRAYSRIAKEKLRRIVRSTKPDDDGTARYGVSPRFLAEMEGLVDRRVPISVIFGEADDLFGDFDRARTGPLGELMTRAGAACELTVVPGKLHGFTSVTSQDAGLRIIRSELERIADTEGFDGAP